MTSTRLSPDAIDLLLACTTGRIPTVDDGKRAAYRELAEAGIMDPLHTFSKGDESAYRFTEVGWRRRFDHLSAICLLLARTAGRNPAVGIGWR